MFFNSDQILTIILAFFASGGLWAFITALWAKHSDNSSAEKEMLKGLGHDKIYHLGEKYLKDGKITKEDYENLYEYLYIPYRKLGGNGTAEKIMMDVQKLPLIDKGGGECD